jgi:hypothetical protein
VLPNRIELAPLLALLLGSGTFFVPSKATRVASDAWRAPRPEVSYADDVYPILENRCIRCHGGIDEGEVRLELSLNMTTYEGLMLGSEYGEVITPGDPDDSVLIQMIEDGDMPDEGDPVPPEELEILRAWIAEGANNN